MARGVIAGEWTPRIDPLDPLDLDSMSPFLDAESDPPPRPPLQPRELAALSVACARLMADLKAAREDPDLDLDLGREVDPRAVFGPLLAAASSSR